MIAALTTGCVLDWDDLRPVAPADARVEASSADADAGIAADQATPDAAPDMYWQDFSWTDAPQDAAPPDASPDAVPDTLQQDAPPCGYRFSGQATADASAGAVNALVAQGWQPQHFVHAADDHAAWLKDTTGHYEVARSKSGKGLETLVTARLGAGKGHTVVELLANTDYAVWMESTTSTGSKYSYVGDSTSSSTVATGIQNLVKQGWKVARYAHQPLLDYAVWQRKGDAFKLLERSYNTTLKSDMVKDYAAGWTPQRFLVRDTYPSYVGWAYHKTKDEYDFVAYSNQSGLLNWLQNNKTNGWDAQMIHSSHLHSVWLTNGHFILYANNGWNLAGQLYKHRQAVKAAKVERFFAKKDYVVWLDKACPP